MTKAVAKLEKSIERLHARLKRVEEVLELSDTIVSFDWKEFSERDRAILKALLRKGPEGATTTELALELDLPEPETSGRTIVYTRLKRIERISKRIKGLPIVVSERKRWYLNYTDFSFPQAKEKET